MRESGILLPISSLPSPYGIGCFSAEAYEFIDQLAEAGQSCWQILPIGPTGYGDSPYQSFSTFAGNPYFIDLTQLISDGLLTIEECLSVDFGDNARYIDYGKIYENRFPLLRKAFLRSKIWDKPDFLQFVEENVQWLPDYALYMALKKENGEKSWMEWEESLRFCDSSLLERKREEWKEEILFHEFLQYIFQKQWKALKKYAVHKKVKLIGDLPIYVSLDSVDAWMHKELFQFDEKGRPTAVAGCPPDGFSADGQLWGNPLYRWDYHVKTGFHWWMQRLSFCNDRYDIVRIDHFRGFDEYYSIPFGDKTAVHGHWEKGPGIALFEKLKQKLPKQKIIAEDLGYVTESVRELVKNTGFPGMKVLEFAFDSRDTGSASDYLPHNYSTNSVVYTGTHDNETITGWFCHGLKEEEKQMVRDYFCDQITPDRSMYLPILCGAMRSVAKLCIFPIQDLLGYDNEARINIPSTSSGNWRWRLLPGEFSYDIRKQLAEITLRYGRRR